VSEASRFDVIAPGATIGIVGGGQLGRMTALAAARLGYRCHVLCPEHDAPAAEVAAGAVVAAYEDRAALERFAAGVDVVTIEFENLPVPSLEFLATRRPVRPAPGVLAICQDRAREKAFLRGIGAPTAAYAEVGSAAELAAALAGCDGPAVLKTARLGYDGKGQVLLRPGDDPGAAWARFGASSGVLEGFVDFEREISVITARGRDGAPASYVQVENRHREHILDTTTAPAPIPEALAAQAVALAERIGAALDLVGVLAVEMFVTRTGGLLVNELAPRPHNSGHWTIDACAVSQFEQLVRAICGLPLGDPTRFADATMHNLLGDAVAQWARILAEPGARLHLYGKREARPGRKMGHVTRLRFRR
jgi:5-(carboxyamino)imidazole ribonucleotide synthase